MGLRVILGMGGYPSPCGGQTPAITYSVPPPILWCPPTLPPLLAVRGWEGVYYECGQGTAQVPPPRLARSPPVRSPPWTPAPLAPPCPRSSPTRTRPASSPRRRGR